MVTPTGPNSRLLIELEYATALERHTLRMHARATESTPSGPSSDFAYVSPNSGLVPETTVLATLASLGALWSVYYAGDWRINLRGLWGFDLASGWTRFATIPTWAGVAGTLALAQNPGDPTTQQRLHLQSVAGRRRRLWLRQLATGHVDIPVDVTPVSGGYDARDVAWISYLSGSDTACLAPDGEAFFALGRVSSWWDRPRAFPWTADALA